MMDPKMRATQHDFDDPARWLDDSILRRLLDLNPPPPNGGRRDTLVVPDELLGRVRNAHIRVILSELDRQARSFQAAQPVDLLALRLSSSGRPRLLDHVRRVGAFAVGDIARVIRLLDFGAESLVFLGEGANGGPVAIKVPFLDYTDLAHLDVEQLLRRRGRLVHEADMLRALSGTALPGLVGQHVGSNPLFPAAIPPFLRDREQFVVLEYIQGARLDALARSLHHQERACCTSRLAAQMVSGFLELCASIADRIGEAAVYTDIKPENALLDGTAVRIVDASSIALNRGGPGPFAVSELYLDPIDHTRWKAGELIPDSGFVLRCLRRSACALVSHLPLFVAQPSPAWPLHAAADLGPTLDGLSSSLPLDIEGAAERARALLGRVACEHGVGPLEATTPSNELPGLSDRGEAR